MKIITTTRRQFMMALSASGISCLLPHVSSASANSPVTDRDRYLRTLIKVMDKEASRHGDKMQSEQIDNLTYAFDTIRPATHVEMAIVAACGMSFQDVKYIPDEYVRRKREEFPQLPWSRVMRLERWGVPDTEQVFVFREQLIAFLDELTDGRHGSGRELVFMIYRGELSPDGLYDLLSERYRQELMPSEVVCFHDVVTLYAPTMRQYIWCSTMVSRAEQLVRESRKQAGAENG